MHRSWQGIVCNASVILAVGLPIKRFGEQGESFRKYLLRNKEVTFRCNDTRFHVKIEGVEVYAQGFAAVAEHQARIGGCFMGKRQAIKNINLYHSIDGRGMYRRTVTDRQGIGIVGTWKHKNRVRPGSGKIEKSSRIPAGRREDWLLK